MQELLEWLEFIEETEDTRQQSKVLHPLKNILVIVLFATLANADDWLKKCGWKLSCDCRGLDVGKY